MLVIRVQLIKDAFELLFQINFEHILDFQLNYWRIKDDCFKL